MKKLLLLLLFFNCSFSVFNQTVTYNKLLSPYGNNPNTSAASSSIITKGSGYIISGAIFDTLNNNYQTLFFYKLDSVGSISKTINFSNNGFNYYYNFSSLIETYDGGYCYAGDMDDTTNFFNNYVHFLIRFDSNMDTLWTRIIPHDTTLETIYHIQETSDKGFVMVGSRYISPVSNYVLLIKTDSLGNQLWRKFIPANNTATGSSIIETQDKGFLINGFSFSYLSFGIGDPFLMKTDSAGNLEWVKYFGGNQFDGSGSMALCNDGNILYAFGYSSFTYPFNENYDARLNVIKLSPNGTQIWNRMYDKVRGNLNANKIQVLTNNDFIVMGSHSERDSANFFPTYLFKFNANGDSLWRRIYYMVDHFVDMNLLADNVLNADGGITACGWVIGDTLVPSQQIWLLKTDSNGYAPGPQNYVGIIDLPYLQVGYGGLKVYPNPATTQATITYPPLNSQGQLQLYNTMGQIVYSAILTKNNTQTVLDTRAYEKGMYKVVLREIGEIRGQASLIIAN